MILKFEFATVFSAALGLKNILITLPGETTTLDEGITVLFEKHPDFKEVLAHENLMRNGRIFAVFICRETILRPDTVLTDGAHIRVVTPISGG